MTENNDDKKEDDNKPEKKSSNKKFTPKNKSVQFTNVNDTDAENNEECALYSIILRLTRTFQLPMT